MTCARCSIPHGVSHWPHANALLCWRCAMMGHQRQAVEIARTKHRYGWLWDPGTGKTIGIYSIVADGDENGWPGPTLVIAPKSILYSTWLRDSLHFPQLKSEVIWHSSAAKRHRMIEASMADVIITNYETFRTHAEEFKRKGITRLVVDEAGKLKHEKSQISEAVFLASLTVKSIYLLTGTPAPNGEVEYFGSMRSINRWDFGPGFFKWASTYFCPIKETIWQTLPTCTITYFDRPGGEEKTLQYKCRHDSEAWEYATNRGWIIASVQRDRSQKEVIKEWKLMDSQKEAFHQLLAKHSWTLRKEDCLDLPERMDIVREIALSASERTAYDTMLDELRVDLPDGDHIDARTAGKTMKLRQITGGMILDNGRPTILGQSKLDALAELLDELEGKPVVIWAQFTEEINRIATLLKERKETFEIIDGRVTDARRRGEIVGQFQAGEIKYLVCHPEATGHGQTFTRASYTIFYSYDYNADTHGQARDRIHRIGQTEKCTYLYICAKGTIDERMYWVLKNKKKATDATKELLAWLRSEVKGGVEVAA